MPQPAHMQLPDVIGLQGRSPAELLDSEDLLVVLGAPGATRAPYVRELMSQALPSLTKTNHYLKTHAGFLDQKGTKPFVVVDWEKPGANALERRWLAQKVGAVLGERYSAKRRTILLEGGAGAAELAIAEDFITREGSPRYDRSLLAGSRLIAADPNALKAADPHRAARTKRQMQYRAWVNENPDELTSIVIGERLGKFCREHDCRFEAFEEKRLTELGMNLLLAVGQASTRSPSRLYIATHNVKPGDRPLMLIGKGITFDTGGINLKPHEGFVNCMKNDMGGAGLMSSLFMALVESGYEGPLAVVIPTCENLIGEGAFKPGAIIKSYAGKDVIIEHTDAEGRLILADAIHYAQKQMNPALSVVAATLTTASLRQFTNFFTAVHFAPEPFKQQLTAAGAAWGEQFTFWDEFLPFAQGNKTQAADLTNMGRMPKDANIGGGCNVAAHFLKEFAVAPLVHCDIFASTWNWSGDYPGAHYGATGAPFNSLFAALRG
jgi:leucyl aminopeptidase